MMEKENEKIKKELSNKENIEEAKKHLRKRREYARKEIELLNTDKNRANMIHRDMRDVGIDYKNKFIEDINKGINQEVAIDEIQNGFADLVIKYPEARNLIIHEFTAMMVNVLKMREQYGEGGADIFCAAAGSKVDELVDKKQGEKKSAEINEIKKIGDGVGACAKLFADIKNKKDPKEYQLMDHITLGVFAKMATEHPKYREYIVKGYGDLMRAVLGVDKRKDVDVNKFNKDREIMLEKRIRSEQGKETKDDVQEDVSDWVKRIVDAKTESIKTGVSGQFGRYLKHIEKIGLYKSAEQGIDDMLGELVKKKKIDKDEAEGIRKMTLEKKEEKEMTPEEYRDELAKIAKERTRITLPNASKEEMTTIDAMYDKASVKQLERFLNEHTKK